VKMPQKTMMKLFRQNPKLRVNSMEETRMVCSIIMKTT